MQKNLKCLRLSFHGCKCLFYKDVYGISSKRPDQLDYSLEYLQGISDNIPTLGTRQSRNEIYWIYMIAQLRNLAEWDRVPFPSKQIWRRRGGECRHGRTISLCSVLRFPASKHQEKVFKNIFNGIFGQQEVWLHLSWFGISTSSVIFIFISFVNFRATSLISVSYIFPPTVVLRTLFLILNICYELTISVWVLQ